MQEEWRTIPDTNDLYDASSLGRIRSKDRIVTRVTNGTPNQYLLRGRIRKALRAPNGYLMLSVHCGEGRQMTTVHRLVARAWMPEGNVPGAEINHIDGDKLNNQPGNLEWVSHSANIAHAQSSGLKKDLRAVIARPAIGGCPILHPSLNEAARVIGGSQPNISRAVSTGGTAHGYAWQYADAA